MGKKLVAVTEIRHDEEVFAAGETLDASKFNKKQLEALYDAGAVRVDESEDEDVKPENEENKNVEDKNVEDKTAKPETPKPATSATATPAKSVAAPATKETASGKGAVK